MAKNSATQKPLIPTTPEELAALSQPQQPKSSLHQTTGQLPAKPATVVPQALQGPQGELLTGMPPKPPAGPQTEIPLEMRGAQGELVTQPPPPPPAAPAPPTAPAAPAPVQAPSPAPAPATGPVSGPTGQITAETAGGRPEWLSRLGTIAKNTGKGILEVIADFAHGYSGMEGPNVTQAREAREHEERLIANEREFAMKMQELQQQWQEAQATARNAEDLEQQRRAIEAQAAQAEADRASNERIAGLRAGNSGAIPGEDPVLRWFREMGYK